MISFEFPCDGSQAPPTSPTSEIKGEKEPLLGTSVRKNTHGPDFVNWKSLQTAFIAPSSVLRRAHADALRALRRAGGNDATGVAAAAPVFLFCYI